MDYITTYFRDNKQVSNEEWSKMLKEDIAQENSYRTWDISYAVYSDIGKGRDVEVNGHDYSSRTDLLFDSAKDLFDYLMFEGYWEQILGVIEKLPEKEMFNIISKIEVVNVQNEKLLLKDEKEW